LIRREFYNIWLTATDEQTASLLSAMIVGDDSHLTKDVKSAFKESNLSHILVVSGAHVGYFSATVGILCSVFFKGKKRFVLISAFLILFGFVTGWGDSAFRSILTYIVVGLISFDSRCVDHVSACALSGIILMCLDPFSVFSYGLLLSFGATFSIMLFQRRAGKLVRKWFPILPDEVRTAVSALICAHLGMIPVLAIMGSLISPLSVLVVIIAGFPAEVICSLGMILTVICLFVPFRMICTILFIPVRGLVSILKVLADIGSMDAPGRIRISHVPEAGLIAFSCVILCILVRCGFKRRILAVSAVAAFGTMLVGGWIDPDKISRIYFLDVGQGDCALVCHHGMNILIDGGNQGNGETIGNVMDYLNIESVDIAFISHLDSDHIAGILELWNEGRIKHLYASFWSDSDEMRQLKTVFPDLPSEVGILSQGSIVKVDDDLSFEIIWPKDPVDGGNDDSMVVLCRLYGTKVLFTGDISETVEKALPADELEDISVLKVSHHGSRFSTSGPFLCDKKIGAALISVGYNHYGHPSSEVLKRLRANRIPYYRTDERGCVLLSVTETSWQMDYYFET
jgi:competence protein ComEC